MVPDDPKPIVAEQPPTEPGFTQAQVNAMMAENKRELKAALAATKAELEALKAKLDKPTTPELPVPAPDDWKGQLELVNARHARELELLKNDYTKEKAEREKEVTRRREVERDRELSEALQKANCIDPKRGRSIFLDQIEFLGDDEGWKFRTAQGGILSIEDGVAEELPTYMRRPSTIGNGSGSSTGAPKLHQKRSQLDIANTKLKELFIKANQTGRPGDRVAYTQQKRVVDNLQQELQSASSSTS